MFEEVLYNWFETMILYKSVKYEWVRAFIGIVSFARDEFGWSKHWQWSGMVSGGSSLLTSNSIVTFWQIISANGNLSQQADN